MKLINEKTITLKETIPNKRCFVCRKSLRKGQTIISGSIIEPRFETANLGFYSAHQIVRFVDKKILLHKDCKE